MKQMVPSQSACLEGTLLSRAAPAMLGRARSPCPGCPWAAAGLGVCPSPCPPFRLPFLRCCLAIPWLGRITPNAAENRILIPAPCPQGRGSAFGDGAPRRHLLRAVGLPRSAGVGDAAVRGRGRAGLRRDGRVRPNGCSGMRLCQALPPSLQPGVSAAPAPLASPRSAVAWDQVETMVTGQGSSLAQHPP